MYYYIVIRMTVCNWQTLPNTKVLILQRFSSYKQSIDKMITRIPVHNQNHQFDP